MSLEPDAQSPLRNLPSQSPSTEDSRPTHSPNTGDQDLQLPIVKCRAHRERRLPRCFIDDMPQPLCALPPHTKNSSMEMCPTPSGESSTPGPTLELSNAQVQLPLSLPGILCHLGKIGFMF